VEGAVYSENPVRLVVALYEGTIDAVRCARTYLREGNIKERSRKIDKAHRLLTELLLSLDHDKGGEISANLKRLYSYMQVRLLDANLQQKEEPLEETERLLNDLLLSWRVVAEKAENQEQHHVKQADEPCCVLM
jgi:flagellar protein FliS